MIAIDCRRSWPGTHDVFVNGKKNDPPSVFAVWALWNGGPGVVGYYPRTAGGNVYLSPKSNSMACAYRLCWSVRLAKPEGK